jgi:hypothetical protein
MPEFRFEQEHMRSGAYRIRTWSEDEAENEYLSVDVRGYNESHN